MSGTKTSNDSRPNLFSTLIADWYYSFQKRRESGRARFRFLSYCMVLATVLHALLVLVLPKHELRYWLVPLTLGAALVMTGLLWLIQRLQFGVGDSGLRLGLVIAGGGFAWALTLSLTALIPGTNRFYFLLVGLVALAAYYVVLLTQKSWLIQSGLTDVYFCHAAGVPSERGYFVSCPRPKAPQALLDIFNSRNLKARIRDYLDYGALDDQRDDLSAAMEAALEVSPLSQGEIKSLAHHVQNTYTHHVIDCFFKEVRAHRRDSVLWIKPTDTVLSVWDKGTLIPIEIAVNDALSSDDRPLIIQLKFSVLCDPSTIQSLSVRLAIAKRPTPEAIQKTIAGAFHLATMQTVLKFFRDVPFSQSTSKQTADQFRIRFAHQDLEGLERALGVSIQDWSIIFSIRQPKEYEDILSHEDKIDIAHQRTRKRLETLKVPDQTKEEMLATIFYNQAITQNSSTTGGRRSGSPHFKPLQHPEPNQPPAPPPPPPAIPAAPPRISYFDDPPIIPYQLGQDGVYRPMQDTENAASLGYFDD